MQTAQLIEGIIRILRDNVDGWSTEDGRPHVYPTHPPQDLDREEYPRATVDIIGNDVPVIDIEQKRTIEDAMVDVTVYGVDAKTATQLAGDAKSAILAHHDGTYTDDSGNTVQYLPEWSFVSPGAVSPIIDEGVDEGFTRYNRTVEFGFRTINTE